MKKQTLRNIFCVLSIFVFCLAALLLNINVVYADLNLRSLDYFSGEGTEQSPHIISTVEHINKLAEYVNTGFDCEGLYFVLTQDIDFESSELNPIGNDATSFKGNFDGAGYMVSNIGLNSLDSTKVGFFGVCEDATIKNFGIKNIKIKPQEIAVVGSTYSSIGGLVGVAKSTDIDQCFVQNVDEDYIDAFSYTTTKFAYMGGLVGELSDVSMITNSFSDVNINLSANTTSQVDLYVGGTAGFVFNSTIKNSFAIGDILSSNLNSSNQTIVQYNGGIAGFVEGTYTNIINSNYAGSIKTPQHVAATDTYVKGGLIGAVISNPSQVPNAKNINYCHFYQTSDINPSLQVIGMPSTYNTTSLVLNSKNDVLFFQTEGNYASSDHYDITDEYDFLNIWLIENGMPTLQLFAYYNIEIEQVDHATTTVAGGELVAENIYKFKAGSPVSITVSINEDVKKFYHVQTWRRNQEDIEMTGGVETYEFICSYLSQGKYNVVLKENTFDLKVVIPTEFASFASIRYESWTVGTTHQTQLLYGRPVTISAEKDVNNSESNFYSFVGWFAGANADIKVDLGSGINTTNLAFTIGDSLVPFDDNLSIVLTAKFTRDICRFTVNFDTTMGTILSGEEVLSEEIIDHPMTKNQVITLTASPLEGYEFFGWFKKGETEAFNKSPKLSGYEIKDDTQNIVAKFQQIGAEEDEGNKLSTWAIVGIVAGCLAAIGLTVLIIVLVKRKGSYKANWNF